MKIEDHHLAPFARLDDDELKTAVNHWKDMPWVMDTETNGLEVIGPNSPCTAHWIGMAPVADFFPIVIPRAQFDRVVRDLIHKIPLLIGHNIRFDIHALNLEDLRLVTYDTSVWAYYHSTTSRKSLDFLCAARGWEKIKTPEELKKGQIALLNTKLLGHYLSDDVLKTRMLYTEQAKRPLPQQIVNDFELESAIAKMESRGVLLNKEIIKKAQKEADLETALLLQDIKGMGFKGLLNSPKQLGEWLVENGRSLGRTATGAISTDRASLTRLADHGDTFAEKVLSWRKLSKLSSAFLHPLPEKARRRGDHWALYANVNSTRTATGRFSYSNPNLQQIPKGRNSTLGKKIRQCLYHEDGVSVADYSQVELRVAAALSGETVLLDAFNSGGDPHAETAAAIFKKDHKNVTNNERHVAKTINFGILFGAGPNRLAQELKIPKEEATTFFRNYKRGLPALAEWCETNWETYEISQVAVTISGRARIFSAREDTRPGLSVLVQGTASELMRSALVAAEGAGLEPILSIHDELVLKGAGKHLELAEIMQESAEKAFPECLDAVCFPAEGSSGPSWGEIE